MTREEFEQMQEEETGVSRDVAARGALLVRLDEFMTDFISMDRAGRSMAFDRLCEAYWHYKRTLRQILEDETRD